ncbi:hypothetical protein [Brevibacillus sp. MS2.2]|uniref:hypothetical protein n=1 Tax=Brevibacillus sp. MS2.2 TaxID=2738981 RepID=UPI00156B27DF|nr:hypothetical protein [Brevibacillus sp. MS2.2]NRR23875.1 hypothetical protein [Brevibacillus sp. MS2.2]
MRDYYLLADDCRNAQKVVPSGLGLQKENAFEQLPPISVLEVHLNGTVKRLVLDTDKIKAHQFFKVQGILEPYIVGSLEGCRVACSEFIIPIEDKTY